MCGITGWIDWELDLGAKGHILEEMTNTLSHRGPDAMGVWISGHAALGHCRLVVVDPEGGGQPMTRRRGESFYTIVYNGELYNTAELRDELKLLGHVFYTRNSDTETLLLAYMEWGPACLQRLNGIFAFAVWDEARSRLFIARDRLGVKPIFYTRRGNSFLFGSEIKALLVHPMVQPELDAEGLAEVLAMGPSRTPGCGVFRGIHEVKPAHYLVYDRNGIHTGRYWRLESRLHEDDLDTTAARVRELLRDTVKRQLVADVPVCIFLSGGLDSSALAAFAAEAFKEAAAGPLHTYSVDYEGNDIYFTPSHFQPNSDAQWVARVSDFLGTHHHYVALDNTKLADALIPALAANDIPGMADIDSSLYLFCRQVKKEATVALSGECADEVFGGYPWFYTGEVSEREGFPWIRMLRERVRLLSGEIAEYVRPLEYAAERYREALAEVPRLAGEDPANAQRRELLYLNITRFMPTLLDRKDRMSMASGLEVRVPFSDHRLVEYVWNIPWEMKTCGGMAKGILRRAMAGLLPVEVLARRKSPYPKTHNPSYYQTIRERFLSILDDPGSPVLQLLDRDKAREAAESGQPVINQPWFGQLMAEAQYYAYFIQVDTWLRQYNITIR